MKQTADSLVPLTADMVDGIKAAVEAPAESEPVKDVIEEEAPVPMTEPLPVSHAVTTAGTVKIHISEGKGIDLEFPIGGVSAGVVTPTVPNTTSVKSAESIAAAAPAVSSADIPEVVEEAVKVREVRHDHVKIEKVVFGDETKIEGTTLTIRKDGICEEAVESQELVENIELDINYAGPLWRVQQYYHGRTADCYQGRRRSWGRYNPRPRRSRFHGYRYGS